MPRWATATNLLAAVVVLGYWAARLVWDVADAHHVGGFIPARLSGMFASEHLPAWLTPLTAAFLHADMAHLLFNGVVLLYCGNAIERVTGPVRLVLLFLAGAYLAALAQWWTDPAAALPMIGASGATSALIGSFAMLFGNRRQLVRSPGLNRFLNALWLLAFWLVVQYALDLYGRVEGTLIATPAHIGGFVAGLLLARWLLPARPRAARD
ncbi:rhomboid family intramembrane serine protease [Sphingomicrobium astaxanthinifaciens]|uniref:rhomboid family intramembrane serine protease n=1 Tax=Sphingomicrobium astaxanthinifaciens TaxID=1227949 RepID=UPI001FCBCFAB|nr:rhomboid family intramembrane serine protease [Sphingomicrobium astaxanthinifaciens]MCJ7422328.1 rhomboid family intramembrane serine protease [Sphingomicrobium astaxanthinifaciens]